MPKYQITYELNYGAPSIILSRQFADGSMDRVRAAIHMRNGKREEVLEANQRDSKGQLTSFFSPILSAPGSVLHYKIVNNGSGFDHLAPYFEAIMRFKSVCESAPLSIFNTPTCISRVIDNPTQEQIAVMESLFIPFGFPSRLSLSQGSTSPIFFNNANIRAEKTLVQEMESLNIRPANNI